MEELVGLAVTELLRPEGFPCECGKLHRTGVRHIALGDGVIERLPAVLKEIGFQKPFLVMDPNTRIAAGNRVRSLLDAAGFPYESCCFPQPFVEPDELSVGRAIMAYDASCDSILAVGSGTINDICKILSKTLRIPQAVVATAPSMDGYASNSSSMIVRGVKTTIYSVCPTAIIADTGILREAPMRMIQAGLGDMLAKYVSICEWRVSHLITGEYYCGAVAGMMRSAVSRCAAQAGKLARREDAAVRAVTEGLILSGIAMSFAEVSRPASGLEHYFSHIWQMRAIESRKPAGMHGIEVGVGTLLACKLYGWLPETEPDKKRALDAAAAFDEMAWASEIRRIFGGAADEVIRLEKECGKHDARKHAARLERILNQWNGIRQIIKDELPPYDELTRVLLAAGGPTRPAEIGISPEEVRDSLIVSMEIRDKYIGSSLFRDLGILEEMACRLKNDCEKEIH